MFEVRRSGATVASMLANMRDVPERVMPYAAAAALTKGAKRAQLAVITQMGQAFSKPVAYTLNSTRVESATKDKLSARVAVKDAGSGGGRPTSYLLPEVEGGARSHTGVEVALRRRGLLGSGEWALPQSSSILTGDGNVSGQKVRSILAQLGKARSPYFVGAIGRDKTRGLWERGTHTGGRTGKSQTRSIRAIYVFTTNRPTYRPRLDFTGAAEAAVRDGFVSDFYATAKTLIRKF